MLHGQVGVGQGLGLDALRGVHNEHSSLAGRQGAGHLVIEVHMSRGVDKVQGVGLSVLRLVVEAHRTGLDGDATLALQVHVVQQLALHLPLLHRPADFNEPVGQGGLTVVYMRDDGKISDFSLAYHN